MRAHNVIIVSSGRSTYATGGALDKLIRLVRSMRKTPILVLGPDGDDLMRLCEEIESCEIVYDPNYSGQLFSSVKAGLHATKGAAFVIALDANLLEPEKWAALERELMNPIEENVLRPNNDPEVYPQLITARGVPALMDLPADTDWADAQAISARAIDL